eukprot:CAMPEP_0183443998 /NCGR_PEP_ID=MMETSP0370-20130417/93669_1 /TAXON_ID=268820 /ORGANISM="Peridinium aciculiferum, Strain PAER-2" /LENGTH=280 /DNA_ID=CAMNT_0025634201 /DNA_START=81 /DNA_END=923 /DNA_ORIENTATION=+
MAVLKQNVDSMLPPFARDRAEGVQAESAESDSESEAESDADSDAESDAESDASSESTKPESLGRAAASDASEGGLRRRYKAIEVPLNGMPITTIDEVAVFVMSPSSARCRRRSANMPNIPRSKSYEASRCFRFGGDGHDDDEAQVCKAATSGSCSAKPTPGPELQTGIMKRASEQVMPGYLKLMVSKHKLRSRHGRRSANPETIAEEVAGGGSTTERSAAGEQLPSERQQANKLGTDFTERYAQVLEVLQQNMTLSPPRRRRHSIAVCELGAYGVQENLA